MRWRRRQTYVVDLLATPAGPTEAETEAFYRTVLTALRPETTRVVADLFGRHGPLPPAAREAAWTLHRLHRRSVFPMVGGNYFQGVEVDDCDRAQWEALLTLAPHASLLCVEGGGLFRDLFTSAGTLSSVRAHLVPAQHQRVAAALAAAGAPPLRPRR